MVDVEFMFSGPIDGSGGIPLVDEENWVWKKELGVRVWCYGLMAKINVLFIVDKSCRNQNS